MRGHRMEMLTVILVLKTLLNSIWVFMDDNNTETREYDQRHSMQGRSILCGWKSNGVHSNVQ